MNHEYEPKRSAHDRRANAGDISMRRFMLLLGLAASVGGGVTKLADAMIFGLVTPKDFKEAVEARFSALEGAIATTRSLDSIRMVNHVASVEPLVDSVRVMMGMVETTMLKSCLDANSAQRREYALLRINCRDITDRFGTKWP